MIKKTFVFALFFLVLSIFAQAQAIVENPEFPEGYENWTHKFEKEEKIQNHSATIHVWVDLSNKEELNSLIIIKINGEIIFSFYLSGNVGGHGHPEGRVVLHYLVEGGYFQVDSIELEKNPENLKNLENLEKLYPAFVLKKFQIDEKELNTAFETLMEEADKFLSSLPKPFK